MNEQPNAPGPAKESWRSISRKKSSAEIQQDIEKTLRQIDESLSEIEDRFDLQRTVDPIRHFFATPAGKTILLLGLASFARRKPLLACSLAVGYLYFRRQAGKPVSRTNVYESPGRTPQEDRIMPRKPTEQEPGRGLSREQEPLRGPQVTGPIMVIEAGSETAEDGEYACRNCGHRTYFERKIIVPACPDCGGREFRRETA